jgi:hypothetical protein
VSADQPVHCLKTDINGDWVIYEDAPFSPDIFEIEEIC